jgi:hypothetical protein
LARWPLERRPAFIRLPYVADVQRQPADRRHGETSNPGETAFWMFLGEFPAAGLALRDTLEAWDADGCARQAVSPR